MDDLFAFAISQYQWTPPSRRMVNSYIVSCILHVSCLITLIQYPGLLGTGSFFRGIQPQMSALEPEWRTVAIVTSPDAMQRPSAAVLKRLIYDWDKAAEGGTSPPLLLRWGDEELAAKKEAPPPSPRTLGLEEPEPVADISSLPRLPGTGTDPGGTPGGGTRTGIPRFPPPGTGMTSPKKIPDKVAQEAKKRSEGPPDLPERQQPKPVRTEPEPAEPEQSQQPAPQVFKDKESAIRSQGTGFFGAEGFPIGDYASIVIERVEGNWMIPSNLRNSQGRTTIVFFIGRDGQYLDAQIVVPSGNPSLDIAALSAIIGSNPFPPLPDGFPSDRVGAKFVFSYNERQ
jgi:TonB family protein